MAGPGAASPDTNQSDTNQTIRDLAAEAERLRNGASETLRQLDEKQQQLERNINNTRAAEANVDQMINLLKEIAGRVAPDSKYVQALGKQMGVVREYAARAGASPNENIRNYQPRLNAQIEEIEKLRTEAGQTHSKLVAEIARLERSKEELVFASVIAQTAEFIANARAYLNSVKKILQDTGELANKTGRVLQAPGF
jgi:chromosome segregation ATPase